MFKEKPLDVIIKNLDEFRQQIEMLKKEDLIVNEIARKINMTRQGVRFHIHNLEKRNLICKKSIVARSILYSYGGGRC